MIVNIHGLYGDAENVNYKILSKMYPISEVYSPQIYFESHSPNSIMAETLLENEAVINLLENMGFEHESWGMQLSLTEGGEINHDNAITGLSRYRLSADTRLGE